jgi:hypothetical protein
MQKVEFENKESEQIGQIMNNFSKNQLFEALSMQQNFDSINEMKSQALNDIN